MRKIFSAIVAIVLFLSVDAQSRDDLSTITNFKRIAISDIVANDSCALVADRFVSLVNFALSSQYPSKVSEVVMSIFPIGDSAELHYTASISPCKTSDAMRRMEHVGIVWLVPDSISIRGEAKEHVDKKANDRAKEAGNLKIVFHEHASALYDDKKIFIVYENFLASSQ